MVYGYSTLVQFQSGTRNFVLYTIIIVFIFIFTKVDFYFITIQFDVVSSKVLPIAQN